MNDHNSRQGAKAPRAQRVWLFTIKIAFLRVLCASARTTSPNLLPGRPRVEALKMISNQQNPSRALRLCERINVFPEQAGRWITDKNIRG
jgi:hypothetical protein